MKYDVTLDMQLYGFQWSEVYPNWKCNEDYSIYIRSSHENSFIIYKRFNETIFVYELQQNGDHIDYFHTISDATKYCDKIINQEDQ